MRFLVVVVANSDKVVMGVSAGVLIRCQFGRGIDVMLYPSNGTATSKKSILQNKYFRYLHKTKIIVFTIISVIKQAKFHHFTTIIGRVRLFGHVIYS